MSKMDAINTAKIFELPASKSVGIGEPKQRWIIRRLFDLGILAMPNEKPPTGFQINYSTITVLISIMVFFSGISAFLWNTAYEKGKTDLERQQIMERLDKAEQEVKKAKELQLYNNGAKEEAPKKK